MNQCQYVYVEENTINRLEPQLENPSKGDFRPARNGNLYALKALDIPDFHGGDLPKGSRVPAGDLVNSVVYDYEGKTSPPGCPPGAYSGL